MIKSLLEAFIISSLIILNSGSICAQTLDETDDLALSKNTVLFYGSPTISCDIAHVWNGGLVVLDKTEKIIYFFDNANLILHQEKITINKKDFPVFSEHNEMLILHEFSDVAKCYNIQNKNGQIKITRQSMNKIFDFRNMVESSVITVQNKLQIQVANLSANKKSRITKLALIKFQNNIDTLYVQKMRDNQTNVTNIIGACPRISTVLADNIYTFDADNLSLITHNFNGKKIAQSTFDKNEYPELKTMYVFFKIDVKTKKKYLIAYKNREVFVFLLENLELKLFQPEIQGKIVQVNNDQVYISVRNKNNKVCVYETTLKKLVKK